MDFITGDKFIKIADYCYFPDGANDNNILENTFNVDNIKEGEIYVYSDTCVKTLYLNPSCMQYVIFFIISIHD